MVGPISLDDTHGPQGEPGPSHQRKAQDPSKCTAPVVQLTLPAFQNQQESSQDKADEPHSDSNVNDSNPTCDYCCNNNVECIKIKEGTKYACVPCWQLRCKCSIKDQMLKIWWQERKAQKKQQQAFEWGMSTTIPVVTLLIVDRKTMIMGPICQTQDGEGKGWTNIHVRMHSGHGSHW